MARRLLLNVRSLIQEPRVQMICANNLAYLDGNYELIIGVYQEKLNSHRPPCVDESIFCYIGHLFGRNGNAEEEERWYKLAIEHFEQHEHTCEHVVPCFVKLANFYEKRQNSASTVKVYQSLVQYLIKYRTPSFLHASIVPIVLQLIQYFVEQTQWNSAIAIFDRLIQLVLKEPHDVVGVDKEFQNVLQDCKDIDDSIVIKAYSCYLEIILRYRALTYNSPLRAIEPAFRQVILTYEVHKYTRMLISVYKQFLELVISVTDDFNKLLAAMQRLALELEAAPLVDAAFDMYMRLAQYILMYGMKEGKLTAGFTIGRYRLLAKKGATFTIECQKTMIQLMVYYRNIVEPQFVVDDYLTTMKRNLKHDGSATSIYMEMLEFYLKHRPEHYEQYFRTGLDDLSNRPSEAVAFVTARRIDYIPLIQSLFQYLIQLNADYCRTSYSSAKLASTLTFETKAKLWLEQTDPVDDVICYQRCLEYILELHSIDDEYVAACYVALGEPKRAITVFNRFIYGNPALKYSPNACRRYLRFIYNETLTDDERTDVEHRYAEHFILEGDLVAGDYSFEILPLEDFDMN